MLKVNSPSHLKRAIVTSLQGMRDMKNLQLTPPLLIITMGYPGAGKTYFARQFAEMYDLPRISEEVFRFELFENPQFNDDEDDIIERVVHYSLVQLMKTKQTLVFEGAHLTLAKRKRVYELAAENGYRTLTVWLQTDLETSAKRAVARDRRSPDNKYAFGIDKNTFNYLANKLERPIDKEQSVVVSGKHIFRSQCLTVLRKITSIYSESLANGDTSVINPLADPKQPVADIKRPRQRFIQ